MNTLCKPVHKPCIGKITTHLKGGETESIRLVLKLDEKSSSELRETIAQLRKERVEVKRTFVRLGHYLTNAVEMLEEAIQTKTFLIKSCYEIINSRNLPRDIKIKRVDNKKNNFSETVIREFVNKYGSKDFHVIFKDAIHNKDGNLKVRDIQVLYNSRRLGIELGTGQIVPIKSLNKDDEDFVTKWVQTPKDRVFVLLPKNDKGDEAWVPFSKIERKVFSLNDCKNKQASRFLLKLNKSKMGFVPIKNFDEETHQMRVVRNIITFNYVNYTDNHIVLVGKSGELKALHKEFNKKNEKSWYDFTNQDFQAYHPENGRAQEQRVLPVQEDGETVLKYVGLTNIDKEQARYLRRLQRPKVESAAEVEAKAAYEVLNEVDGRYSISNIEHQLRNYELKYLKYMSSKELYFIEQEVEELINANPSKKEIALKNVVNSFRLSKELEEETTEGLTSDIEDLVTQERDLNANNLKQSKNLYSQQEGVLEKNRNPQDMYVRNSAQLFREVKAGQDEDGNIIYKRVDGELRFIRRNNLKEMAHYEGGSPISYAWAPKPEYEDVPEEEYHHSSSSKLPKNKAPKSSLAESRENTYKFFTRKVPLVQISRENYLDALEVLLSLAPKEEEKKVNRYPPVPTTFTGLHIETLESKEELYNHKDWFNAIQAIEQRSSITEIIYRIKVGNRITKSSKLVRGIAPIKRGKLVVQTTPKTSISSFGGIETTKNPKYMGFYNHGNRKVYLNITKASDAYLEGVLIHELTHYLRHQARIANKEKFIRRLEEAIAYRVMEIYLNNIGKELNPYHKELLASYSKDFEKESFEKEVMNIGGQIWNHFNVHEITSKMEEGDGI